MNYMYLSDEKQAKKLARLLAKDADASDVRLYRERKSFRFVLVFNCRETRKQAGECAR